MTVAINSTFGVAARTSLPFKSVPRMHKFRSTEHEQSAGQSRTQAQARKYEQFSEHGQSLVNQTEILRCSLPNPSPQNCVRCTHKLPPLFGFDAAPVIRACARACALSKCDVPNPIYEQSMAAYIPFPQAALLTCSLLRTTCAPFPTPRCSPYSARTRLCLRTKGGMSAAVAAAVAVAVAAAATAMRPPPTHHQRCEQTRHDPHTYRAIRASAAAGPLPP